jgi:CMP-N-acetylneuraminic acid synthetase
MRKLCVIPARGGSKNIPKKNIAVICDKPLIAFVIDAVLKANVFDRVIVSTDSEEIAQIVRKSYKDVELPFIRPAEYASDTVPVTAVVKHAVGFLESKRDYFDCVFSVQPTNPFTQPDTLRNMVKIMEDSAADSIVTIAKIVHYHPFRSYRYDPETMRITPLTEYTTEEFLQKQDRPDAYGLTGGVFGRRTSLVRAWKGKGFALGGYTMGFLVSDEEAFDLDTPFEMELFEGIVHLRTSRRRGDD